MSKAKNQGIQQKSVEKLIIERARKLQLYKCYVNSNWKKWKICHIIVCRKHINKNLTFAIILVDLALYGVKETLYKFNAFPDELHEIISNNELEFIEITYELAHNIVYSGIEWAEDFGFNPHKSWQVAQYLLEEDDEKIPLIDIECGIHGKPAIFKNSAISYRSDIQKLEEIAGNGNYLFFDDIDEILDDELDEEFAQQIVNNDLDIFFPRFWDEDFNFEFEEMEGNNLAQLVVICKIHYEKYGKKYLDDIDLITYAIGEKEILERFLSDTDPAELFLEQDIQPEDLSFEEICEAIEKFPESSYLFELIYNSEKDYLPESDNYFFDLSEKTYHKINDNLIATGNYLCNLANAEKYDEFNNLLIESRFQQKVINYKGDIPWLLFVYYCACCAYSSMQENKFEDADKYYFATRVFANLVEDSVVTFLAIKLASLKILELDKFLAKQPKLNVVHSNKYKQF
jgi:hypothetical protein